MASFWSFKNLLLMPSPCLRCKVVMDKLLASQWFTACFPALVATPNNRHFLRPGSTFSSGFSTTKSGEICDRKVVRKKGMGQLWTTSYPWTKWTSSGYCESPLNKWHCPWSCRWKYVLMLETMRDNVGGWITRLSWMNNQLNPKALNKDKECSSLIKIRVRLFCKFK